MNVSENFILNQSCCRLRTRFAAASMGVWMKPAFLGLATACLRRAALAFAVLAALSTANSPAAVAEDLGPMLDLGTGGQGFEELGGFLPPQGYHHASVVQQGEFNQLAAVQTGWHNQIDARQIGAGNAANLEQTGALLAIQLSQDGSGNRADIRQIGQLNVARVGQVGVNNVAEIVQLGIGLRVDIVQNGNNNVARVIQR